MKEYLSAWFDLSNHLDNEEDNWTKKYVQIDVNSRRLRILSNECIRSQNAEPDRTYPMLSYSQSNVIFPCLSEYLPPSILNDEKSIKSSSIDCSSDRCPSSITTTTTARQSKTKFSHFFTRSTTNQKSQQHQTHINNSLKRTKSVTKLEQRPKPSFFSTHFNNNIPSNRSRSHESLYIGNGPLGSIVSPDKPIDILIDNCQIRRIHPSILDKNHLNSNEIYQCIQIENHLSNEKYYLRSKESYPEKNSLFNHLHQISLEKSLEQQRFDNSLDICILEGKGLPMKKNLRYYVKIFLDDVIYGKTSSQERREILFWGEYFLFQDLPEHSSVLSCQIYREYDRRKSKQHEHDLLASIDIPLSTITGNQFVEQWYSFQPINLKNKSTDGSIQIRIKAKYQPIQILPMENYRHLQEYLRRNYLSLISILEPHISLRDKDDIATSLTRIAQSLCYSTEYLVDIIQAEVLSTSDNTLTFRGNSIATKSMEAYMKLIGENYLHETLKRFVREIVFSKDGNDLDLEVDPDRVMNIQYLQRNQINLRFLCEKIWIDIQQSSFIFPQELKIIFSKLRQLSSSDETMFHLISGSVFLRFLCPAILSPNLFGLTQEYPNERASRKLTLIAKTLQTLANFSKFGSKESYMKFMNDFVSKESDNMRRFLANISTIDDEEEDDDQSDSSCIELRSDIDLGREYSIIHETFANLFEEVDHSFDESLNDFKEILNELSQLKSSYFSSKSNREIHVHHHHHHIYHHHQSPSTSELSLNGTGTTHTSSQGYHSISNQDSNRQPLTFFNPIYYPTKQFNSRRQTTSSQQSLPKMGLKALNHIQNNQDSSRSTLFNLYHEEKSRRIECEKESERLRFQLERSNEQLKEYRFLIHQNIFCKSSCDCYDDDSKPLQMLNDDHDRNSHIEDQIE